ncbi:hypothetical protein U6A24_18150 [Aquimarina gracilis]|uniref:CpeT/CpcT family protein DUF1001 n=1 Tax=Aquimarina gracilis TaxID=874422 RepID=A0ABU5ZZZ5_9FLAO|nr:hypothetical protein [Aquimarina gracilis]MEB3347403.1 hypothetical protein [Aquimarina gracilis]
MKRSYLYILLLFWVSSSCQNSIAIDNIQDIPKATVQDQRYADVFKILDGYWKGKFLIFEDKNPVLKDQLDLKDISFSTFQKRGLKQINSIQVEQIYTSETPYFQKVTITDFYPDSGKKVISEGVNKIQEGQMWCVVKKPDETVIHAGSTKGKSTIVWQRNEKDPQKIEYFKETVSQQFYEIIGWGYYQGDDPKLSPKLWFYAKYKRQNLD